MALRYGFLALLEAKDGKAGELESFLESGRELAVAEPGTITWYAFKVGETTFGIFDTFETEEARNAHLNGEIPRALGQVGADLLGADPDIRPIDIVAVKQPSDFAPRVSQAAAEVATRFARVATSSRRATRPAPPSRPPW